ncbi:hypothetical protein EVAR_65956_1 [Eumeta japonica]|uniref:Uncharacterized protein n=1 Tax=Eumeta variegata TaxID=151549 RepID=A0A4C1Z8W9_EUMVA|nr:hypothetical protein EVAR_65956_1 [Eumeta japonica]
MVFCPEFFALTAQNHINYMPVHVASTYTLNTCTKLRGSTFISFQHIPPPKNTHILSVYRAIQSKVYECEERSIFKFQTDHGEFMHNVKKSESVRPIAQRERCLIWDATCINTFAAFHLNSISRVAASEAETAANQKHLKYSILNDTYLFNLNTCETTGLWGSKAKSFKRDLGERHGDEKGDPCSGSYLFQTQSVGIPRGDAASVMGTIGPSQARGVFL